MSPVSKGRRRKPKKPGRSGSRPNRSDAGARQDLDRHAHLSDPSLVVPAAADDEALERRLFTVPHRGAVVGGEEYERLDPADPDERSLLIKGEHPEFQEYLDNASWDGEIDGMNPRFHLTMHEVIANQLWADEPAEVWQAAKRLRGQGVERHDILHELVGVMAEHIRPTLARGAPFDEDAYRRALDGLGR